MKKILTYLLLYPLIIIVLIVVLGVVYLNFTTTPSNTRAWNDDQMILPYAEVQGNLVTAHNIRNFMYASTTSYTQNYYDKTFDMSKLKKVYYIVEPFSDFKGAAHTFLSFEFENDPLNSEAHEFLAISIEIRKEKGETFSALKGLLNNYELMYVFADERDAVKLRSNYRKDLVYVYPIKTTQEKAQALFLDMVTRANTLKDNPEFYNSLTNNCTTNIVRHVNTITPKRIPKLSKDVLLPANSDALAYQLGLIDTDLTLEQAREKYLINDRALQYADAPDFSVKIRE